MTDPTLYDTDFYAWTQAQAALLRQGRVEQLDLANLAEEIESMGRSDRRAVGSQLRRLLLHLLKWQYQPGLQGPSWRRSIDQARVEMEVILRDSPSLKGELPVLLSEDYPRARRQAHRETSLPLATFPTDCPWTLDQVLDPDFFPEN